MNILIVGSGGREHALAWKIRQSPRCDELYVAPGNAGTDAACLDFISISGGQRPMPSEVQQVLGGKRLSGGNVLLDVSTSADVIRFAKEKNIGLVVVGPDNQLADGMVDALTEAGIRAFGPTKEAAKLEWSKAFSKEFMKKNGIPCAQSETFNSYTQANERVQNLSDEEFPIVIKADGLALGKGVVVATSKAEAERALAAFMKESLYGDAGKVVVIEEFLEGREVSIHAFCDGETAKLFPVARDHKRIGERDTGMNTGGMGTIAPINARNDLLKEVEEKVVLPVLRGMKKAGTPFRGILFPGLMVTKEGFKVLEFNVRFGDPECESFMRLVESDVVEIMEACIDGTLSEKEVVWSNEFVATVMVASAGYPGVYEKGKQISGLEHVVGDSRVVVFHSGTTKVDDVLMTSGGRVLGVSATGTSPEDATKRAYDAVSKIHFDGMQYRKDIGINWEL